eukprot:353414-Chlamydomonas_euryale.AAC.4
MSRGWERVTMNATPSMGGTPPTARVAANVLTLASQEAPHLQRGGARKIRHPICRLACLICGIRCRPADTAAKCGKHLTASRAGERRPACSGGGRVRHDRRRARSVHADGQHAHECERATAARLLGLRIHGVKHVEAARSACGDKAASARRDRG